MPNTELKQTIQNALKAFEEHPLLKAATSLLETLGYKSDKRIVLIPNTAAQFRAMFEKQSQMNVNKALLSEWKSVDLLFQITDEEIQGAMQGQGQLFARQKVDKTEINSYLFFAIGLKGNAYTRIQLATATREINKLFPMPVIVIFQYDKTLTLSIIARRMNKRDANKDVLEKVTLIKDISTSSPHRAHIEILHDLSIIQLATSYPFSNFIELQRAWEKTLDTSELNKKFYREIADWYFWAVRTVKFPEGGEKDPEKRNSTNVIRLITRLIFVWFIKEKGLVTEDLFDTRRLKDFLNYSDPKKSTYYKAILQNLFFATLNTEMGAGRRFRGKNKNPNGLDAHHGISTVYRYEDYFKDSKTALNLFAGIPFLNGGLFECLDKRDEKILMDGFSDDLRNQPVVPDALFFGEEHTEDLSEVYGDARRNHEKVRGLIHIFNSYKFTIEENTPVEEEIALDPELLGKVFENLLAAYNPETGTTARKQTGSFYTPREIVNYMVDEGLVASLEGKLNGAKDAQARLRHLFAYNNEPHQFTEEEEKNLIFAIDSIKVLDPACGSGAFPMGILNKLVFILNKLDPHNEHWKERQIAKASEILDTSAREAAIEAIEEVFKQNYDDYGRKLYLIENCIYGVDIQPIAVQIAKLRFFISLVVEQKPNSSKDNIGVKPLPNLETKFVAADTLLCIEKPKQMAFRNPEIDKKEKQLAEVRQALFTARTPTTKQKYRQQDALLRAAIAVLLQKDGWGSESARQLAGWDPYDQNSHADFFDPEWMFGIEGGFDVVIGNPPYVSAVEHSKSNPELREKYKHIYNLLKGAYDLYVAFLLRGDDLINKNGNYSWIIPNKFLVADYAQEIRRHLTLRGLHTSIDVSHYDIFENGVYPIIVFGNRNTKNKFTMLKINDLEDLNNRNFQVKDTELRERYKTFKDFGIEIYSGTTGFQAHQIISSISEIQIKGAIPFIVSGCVDRYSIDFRNVRYMRRTYDSAYIQKNKYVADSKWKFWVNEKIVIAGMTKVLEATYFQDPLALGVGIYGISNYGGFLPKFLLGLLNSKFMSYFLLETFPDKHLAGGYIAINKSTIEKLPLVALPVSDQKPIADLVSQILAAKLANSAVDSSALESKIDEMVFELFEVTDKEKKIVEKNKI